MASTTEYNKACKAAGICIQCKGPASGKLRCQACSDKNAERRRIKAEQHKREGRCVTCGKPAKEGCVVCEYHATKAAEDMKKRYRKHKKAGLCPYCGSAETDGRICQRCRDTQNRNRNEWYEERKAAGLCLRCGKQLPADTRLTSCDECRADVSVSGKAKRESRRKAVLAAYGGPVCRGCGDEQEAILEIDHIDGGGTQHLKKIGQSGLYRWLEQNNYPPGFRVLCPTCNKKAHKKIPLPNEAQS